jgi:hypothetical protein
MDVVLPRSGDAKRALGGPRESLGRRNEHACFEAVGGDPATNGGRIVDPARMLPKESRRRNRLPDLVSIGVVLDYEEPVDEIGIIRVDLVDSLEQIRARSEVPSRGSIEINEYVAHGVSLDIFR